MIYLKREEWLMLWPQLQRQIIFSLGLFILSAAIVVLAYEYHQSASRQEQQVTQYWLQAQQRWLNLTNEKQQQRKALRQLEKRAGWLQGLPRDLEKQLSKLRERMAIPNWGQKISKPLRISRVANYGLWSRQLDLQLDQAHEGDILNLLGQLRHDLPWVIHACHLQASPRLHGLHINCQLEVLAWLEKSID